MKELRPDEERRGEQPRSAQELRDAIIRAAIALPEFANRHDLRLPPTTNPFMLWVGPPMDPPLHPPWVESRQLLEIDLVAWFDVLDEVQLPSMRWSLFRMSDLHSDRDLVLKAIELAPIVFDTDGAWTRSIAGLLAVDSILHHSACPDWLRTAYRAVLARDDGKWIAGGLLHYLAKRSLWSQRPYIEQGAPAIDAAFDAQVDVLACGGVSMASFEQCWQQLEELCRRKYEAESSRSVVRAAREKRSSSLGEGARTLHLDAFPLLYGIAAVLERAGAPVGEADRYWRWLTDVLIRRPPGLSPYGGASHWIKAALPIAGRLLQVSSPAAAWCSSYNRLEPQRRRSLYWTRYEEHDRDGPSILLIYIGLQACALAAAEPRTDLGPVELHQFFWTLYDAARRLWLTDPRDVFTIKRELVADCFVFMPATFGDSLGRALESALPPIANHARLLCMAASKLQGRYTGSPGLVELFSRAGADLPGALREMHARAQLTGQEKLFPPAFQSLAASLGVALTVDEAPAQPEEDRLQRREAVFLRNIPWGTALLSRLRQDGCTPTHLEPIEETGASWVLQVRVPESLSDAFGLAPEIRIVVAPGRFDGRDLSRAAEHPAGVEAVDPDLLIIAADRPDRVERLPLLPGPWGQRIPWLYTVDGFAPLEEQLRRHAQDFDLFQRFDPVHGRQLFGRRQIRHDLMARLVRGQAVGVFGLRKVGKSSLLQAVAEQLDPIGAQLDPLQPAPERSANVETHALVVSLDVQILSGRELAPLAHRLAEKLRARMDAEGLRPPEVSDGAPGEPLRALEEQLRFALTSSPLPICVILDEYDLLFEGYGGEPGIPGAERLFALFRALAQETRRMSIALIGRDPDFVQRPLLGGFTNPLLGWCEPFWLGPLHRDEADALLHRLGRRVGLEIGPKTMDAAWSWTGGHPLLLRQYGSALLELARAREGRPGPFATDDLRDEAAAMFRRRDAVIEILREIRALLSRRFPDAMTLFQDLTSMDPKGARAAVVAHGGWDAEPAQILQRFGLLKRQVDEAQIAEVFRRGGSSGSPARATKGRRLRTRRDT